MAWLSESVCTQPPHTKRNVLVCMVLRHSYLTPLIINRRGEGVDCERTSGEMYTSGCRLETNAPHLSHLRMVTTANCTCSAVMVRSRLVSAT